jgi:hypothetical protein
MSRIVSNTSASGTSAAEKNGRSRRRIVGATIVAAGSALVVVPALTGIGSAGVAAPHAKAAAYQNATPDHGLEAGPKPMKPNPSVKASAIWVTAIDRMAKEQRASREAHRTALTRKAAGSTSGSRTSATGGSPQAIAQAKLAQRGWSGQFSCLSSLWSKESGWRVSASNPSGAYGIPQALPGSKMSSAGSDWRTNPATQIEWGLDYISSTYGSPCAAWSHSRSNNWY